MNDPANFTRRIRWPRLFHGSRGLVSNSAVLLVLPGFGMSWGVGIRL